MNSTKIGVLLEVAQADLAFAGRMLGQEILEDVLVGFGLQKRLVLDVLLWSDATARHVSFFWRLAQVLKPMLECWTSVTSYEALGHSILPDVSQKCIPKCLFTQ